MKNITLSVDEDVLAKVRRYASEKNTTVNALVREHLTRIATQEDRAARARQELIALSESSIWDPGPDYKWSRADLYDDALSRHQHLRLRGAKSPRASKQARKGEAIDRRK